MNKILITTLEATPHWQSTLTRRSFFAALAIAGLSLGFAGSAWAEQHTAGTPALSSKPGAPYTIYLDFAGFNYTGGWAEHTPGVCPSFDDVASNGTFGAPQIERIKTTWAITSSFYAAFNINVTTVDPAPAGLTDAQRQTFYNQQPNFMHSILTVPIPGGVPAGGSSGIGTVVGTHNPANDPDTQHTNFILFDPGFNVVDFGNATAHENGHALGLTHQSDYVGDTEINEYGLGDTTASGPNTGIGSYTAVMGGQNGQQRKTFRAGSSNNFQPGNFSNDVKTMLASQTAANATALGRTGGVDLRLVDSGIGHTLATATTLPLNANGTVNFVLASGVIVPTSESNPIPLGAGNYTKDFFKFTVASPTAVSLTVNNGTQYLTPGVADPGITLRSVLKIHNAAGGLLATATEDASTLIATYSGTLAAGTYYASVESYGGHQQVNLQDPTFEPGAYFDMGGYFLTGSGFAPATNTGLVAVNDAVVSTTGATTVYPLANDTDAAGAALTITSVSEPSVTINGRTLVVPAGYAGTFTYTVSNGSGTETANVVVTAGTPLVGASKWGGLLYDGSDAIAGVMRLNRSSTGRFSGSLRVGVDTKGVLFRLTAGTATVPTTLGTLTVTEEASGRLAISLAGPSTLTGSLRPGKTSATAGKHNIALAAIDPAIPGGGFARASVAASGSITVNGKLPDGRAFSAASRLADNGTFTIYTPIALTSPKGVLAGEFVTANLTATDVTGELEWNLPAQATGLHSAGVSTILTANGSAFTPGGFPPNGAGTLTLSGGDLAAASVTAVTIASGKPTLTPIVRSWVINPTSGTFISAVKHPVTNTLRTGSGVYLSKSHTAWGFFRGTTVGGKIELKVP